MRTIGVSKLSNVEVQRRVTTQEGKPGNRRYNRQVLKKYRGATRGRNRSLPHQMRTEK